MGGGQRLVWSFNAATGRLRSPLNCAVSGRLLRIFSAGLAKPLQMWHPVTVLDLANLLSGPLVSYPA